MNAKDLRIVFMGTPEFAVTSLRALVEGGYNIVGVVTTPDKPVTSSNMQSSKDFPYCSPSSCAIPNFKPNWRL